MLYPWSESTHTYPSEAHPPLSICGTHTKKRLSSGGVFSICQENGYCRVASGAWSSRSPTISTGRLATGGYDIFDKQCKWTSNGEATCDDGSSMTACLGRWTERCGISSQAQTGGVIAGTSHFVLELIFLWPAAEEYTYCGGRTSQVSNVYVHIMYGQ